jgi:hypothetical protein
VAEIVTETMWRDDVWVEVRVVESTAPDDAPPPERVLLKA